MTGIGLLLLCFSWISLATGLSSNEITIKAILEGAGLQATLTFVAIVVYSVGCILPFFGNILIVALAFVGSYYFPQMSITFLCTAFGICLLLFSISGPNEQNK